MVLLFKIMVGKTMSDIKNNETEFTYLTRMVGSFMGDEEELKPCYLLSIALFLFCFVEVISIAIFVDMSLNYKSIYDVIPELIVFTSSVVITFFSWQLLRKIGLCKGVRIIANRIEFKQGIQTGLAVMQFEHLKYKIALLNELFLPRSRVMRLVFFVSIVIMYSGVVRHVYLMSSREIQGVDLGVPCLSMLTLALIFLFIELQNKTERLLDESYLKVKY